MRYVTLTIAALSVCVAGCFETTSSQTRTYPNVVRTADGKLKPLPGYKWVSKEKNNFSVRWAAGLRHPTYRNVISIAKVNHWRPIDGFEWDPPTGSGLRHAKWTPGMKHTKYPNIFASAKQGQWSAASGYTWASENKNDLRVVRKSGSGGPQVDKSLEEEFEKAFGDK